MSACRGISPGRDDDSGLTQRPPHHGPSGGAELSKKLFQVPAAQSVLDSMTARKTRSPVQGSLLVAGSTKDVEEILAANGEGPPTASVLNAVATILPMGRGVFPSEINTCDPPKGVGGHIGIGRANSTTSPEVSLSGLVDAILEVGHQRKILLDQLRSALVSGNDGEALRLARQLCGLPNEGK